MNTEWILYAMNKKNANRGSGREGRGCALIKGRLGEGRREGRGGYLVPSVDKRGAGLRASLQGRFPWWTR